MLFDEKLDQKADENVTTADVLIVEVCGYYILQERLSSILGKIKKKG